MRDMLGPYRVLEKLGEGGMGEVYRATDTVLGRQVAIKVLPEAFAQDADRLARFEREARTLAALNHPHIAQIYGLEKSGGTTALVMELVEGPTLADRIAHEPIPVDEALAIAKQIAEALEAAHEQGIIHRDLKPANIKVRDDGTVKVLDFGLAKVIEEAGRQPAAGGETPSQSPTITSPALLTGAGVILGTAAYMAPEQARGKPVDKRADIWAFGCVLFEMLSGKRPFAGDTVPDVLAEIVKSEPAWRELTGAAPTRVTQLLQRCLDKDPRRRLRDIGEARVLLEADSDASSFDRMEDAPRRRMAARAWLSGGAAVGLFVAVVAWAAFGRGQSTGAFEEVTRMAVTLDAPLADLAGFDLAVSSDGRRIVYVSPSQDGNTLSLYVRDLASLTSRELEGTRMSVYVGNVNPFFSADGRTIVYRHGGIGLMAVDVDGGQPRRLLGEPVANLGGTGMPDGSIVIARANQLYRIDATGAAEPELLSTAAEEGALYAAPAAMPDGRTLLVNVLGGTDPDGERIAALDVASGTLTMLLDGAVPRYSPTGHLVFARGTDLMAVPFDAETLRVSGSPVLIEAGVRHPGLVTAADYGLSSTGTLAFVSSRAVVQRSLERLVWRNRAGEVVGSSDERVFESPRGMRVSPDGGRVVFSEGPTSQTAIWIVHRAGAPPLRLLDDGRWHMNPVWSPDGQRVAFAFDIRAANPGNAAALAADGSVLAPERIESIEIPATAEYPMEWVESGGLLFQAISEDGDTDLFTAPVAGNGELRPLVATPFNEWKGRASPDGRWIAYTSDRSGAAEVWVQRLGHRDVAPVQVSRSGGHEPVWSRAGDELYFLSANTLMAAAIDADEDAFSVVRIAPLFQVPASSRVSAVGERVQTSYDVTPDGLFVMAEATDDVAQAQLSAPLVVIQHWFTELERLVPTN